MKTPSNQIHRELALTQRLYDEKAISEVGVWLAEMQPFSEFNDPDVLISFSSGLLAGKVTVPIQKRH